MSASALAGPVRGAPRAGAGLLRRSTFLSMVLVTAGILLWLVTPLRGHNVLAVGAIGILFGIPHGIVDVLLVQPGGRAGYHRALATALGTYVAAAAVSLTLVLLAPVIMYVAIVATAVLHWGAGDAVFRRSREGGTPHYGGFDEVVAFGAPVFFLNFVLRPDQVRRILSKVAPGVSDSTRGVMVGFAIVVVVAIVVFLIRTLLSRDWLAAGEVALLVALSTLLPAAVEFGLYFAFWHSLRQTALLFADAAHDRELGVPSALARAGRAGLIRLMVWGTAATLVFGSMAAGLVIAVHGRGTGFGLGDWTAALLGAVVLPHVATVLRYDFWKIRAIPKETAEVKLEHENDFTRTDHGRRPPHELP